MLEQLAGALVQLLSPDLLLIVFLGTLGGFALGAMPGLTATMGLALLVPLTFTMSPVSGLVMLGALYMGAIYGGAFPAILINTPGTPSSVATSFDGYPMMKSGRAEQAIIGATFGSLVGGVIGVVALLVLSPPLAALALQFGPPEYFWIAVFGLTIIASLAGDSLVKGLIGGGIGMLIAAIGVAPIGGDVRFTFGITPLQGGVPFIPMLIGLFTIPEVVYMVARKRGGQRLMGSEIRQESGVLSRTVISLVRHPANAVKSGVIGTVIGIIPGAGGNIASLVAYNEAKRSSKNPEDFGKGEAKGVVASESANNAVVGGGLVPLLTLGVPGAPPDAIIYGVLLIHGLRPGADLFTSQAELTYTFILGIGLAAIAMVPIGLIAGRRLQGLVVRLPVRYLAPGIIVTTILGSYAIRNSIVDVMLMLSAGVLGVGMRLLNFSPAPVVLGLILGPIAERGLVQGLLMGSGLETSWLILFTRPFSIVLIVLTLLSATAPLLARRRKERRTIAVREEVER